MKTLKEHIIEKLVINKNCAERIDSKNLKNIYDVIKQIEKTVNDDLCSDDQIKMLKEPYVSNDISSLIKNDVKDKIKMNIPDDYYDRYELLKKIFNIIQIKRNSTSTIFYYIC